MEKRTFVTSLNLKLPKYFVGLLAGIILLSIYINIDGFQNRFDEFTFNFIMIVFILILTGMVVSDSITRRYINVYEEGLEFRDRLFWPKQKRFITFSDITSIESRDDGHFILNILTEKNKTIVSLKSLSPDGRYYFLEMLRRKKPAIAEPACSVFERLKKREDDFPSIVVNYIIFSMLFSFIFFSAFHTRFDRLLDDDAFSFIQLVICSGIGFLYQKFIFARFSIRLPENRKVAKFTPILLMVSLMILSSTFSTVINQGLDHSPEKFCIVNIERSSGSEEFEANQGPCYEIKSEDLLTKDVHPRICEHELKKATNNSKALLGYKQGFLGQRWIASIKVID